MAEKGNMANQLRHQDSLAEQSQIQTLANCILISLKIHNRKEEDEFRSWEEKCWAEVEVEEEEMDDVNDSCFDDEELGTDDDDPDSFSQAVDPTDRKRRQRELTERFHALSATIPGSKKWGRN
ncbi:hypothetical protein VNO78_24605 [Psophocarpus tetragonolobus]|uniref:Uncharacterized protein n=1 Tax=Psophocarpus tetragonolobus TaxID=3891 RepID=A0AAN9XEF5_PSOTE